MTPHIRALFGILGGGASGVLIALAIAGLCTPTTVGVCVAIAALCVIGIFGCKAVETDGRRAADKARHPAIWTPPGGTRPGTLIYDIKTRDRSGMECGRCGGSTFFSHKCIDGQMVRGSLDGMVG